MDIAVIAIKDNKSNPQLQPFGRSFLHRQRIEVLLPRVLQPLRLHSSTSWQAFRPHVELHPLKFQHGTSKTGGLEEQFPSGYDNKIHKTTF